MMFNQIKVARPFIFLISPTVTSLMAGHAIKNNHMAAATALPLRHNTQPVSHRAIAARIYIF